MNSIRKQILKQRYLNARAVVDSHILGCGKTLARHLFPELDTAYREMESIELEVKRELANKE